MRFLSKAGFGVAKGCRTCVITESMKRCVICNYLGSEQLKTGDLSNDAEEMYTVCSILSIIGNL